MQKNSKSPLRTAKKANFLQTSDSYTQSARLTTHEELRVTTERRVSDSPGTAQALRGPKTKQNSVDSSSANVEITCNSSSNATVVHQKSIPKFVDVRRGATGGVSSNALSSAGIKERNFESNKHLRSVEVPSN